MSYLYRFDLLLTVWSVFSLFLQVAMSCAKTHCSTRGMSGLDLWISLEKVSKYVLLPSGLAWGNNCVRECWLSNLPWGPCEWINDGRNVKSMWQQDGVGIRSPFVPSYGTSTRFISTRSIFLDPRWSKHKFHSTPGCVRPWPPPRFRSSPIRLCVYRLRALSLLLYHVQPSQHLLWITKLWPVRQPCIMQDFETRSADIEWWVFRV